MAFDRYTSESNSLIPKVTISTRNQFYFNRGSIREMDLLNKKFVVLFYDKDENKIGFQPVDQKENGSLSVNLVKDRDNLAVINVKKFLNYYNIPHATTKQYTVEKENDMYVIKLTTESKTPIADISVTV